MDELLITLSMLACCFVFVVAAYTRRSAYVACLALATLLASLAWSPNSATASETVAREDASSTRGEPAFAPPEPESKRKPKHESKHAPSPAVKSGSKPAVADPAGAVELSVKPKTEVGDVAFEVRSDSPRPAWVEVEKQISKDGAQRITVSSGPHTRLRETRLALKAEAQRAVSNHIDDQLGAVNAVRWLRLFVGDKYDLAQLASRHTRRETSERTSERTSDRTSTSGTRSGKENPRRKTVDVPPLYKEQLVVSVGPMHQWYTQIEFDDRFHRQLDSDWQTVVASSRLLQFSLIGGGVLGLLGLLLGFFKANMATRGAYPWRLTLTGVVAIAGLIAAGVLLSRWIPWI